MMDHPNIAKVLDAGTTESGRPYFVMELVRASRSPSTATAIELTIRERLELFIQVCQAIQHAHQKGIIHRDIKPSNVLVTLHDGKPVPKVIDFGVAKALNTRLTDKTIYTEHCQIVGTLLYMSPEQAELSGLDIDTRSDVYSLGVLLYELLTGTTPFQKDELDKAGFDEQRRIIREKEPPRASVRISSLGETATAVAEHRKTEVQRLHQLVRGDLDWIVMRTLEKDRTRRYGTPTELADDVDRYLSDQPVEACPPSSAYRLRKFARRNRALFATSAAVALVMLLAVVTSSWFAWEYYSKNVELQKETARAEAAERVSSEQVTRLDAAKRELEVTLRDLAGVFGGASTGFQFHWQHRPCRASHCESRKGRGSGLYHSDAAGDIATLHKPAALCDINVTWRGRPTSKLYAGEGSSGLGVPHYVSARTTRSDEVVCILGPEFLWIRRDVRSRPVLSAAR